MVHPLGDADRLGPALGYAEPDDVAEEHADDPEVEQRATDPQQPVLVELRGPRGPAELVVAVPPEMAHHEDRETDVRDDHPQDLVHPGAPGKVGMGNPDGVAPDEGVAGLNCGVAKGARPTSSSGGPSAARRRTASRSSPRRCGSVEVTASITPAHGDPASRSDNRSSSSPARWSSISPHPSRWSIVAAYSSTTHRWSGSSELSPLSARTKPERK